MTFLSQESMYAGGAIQSYIGPQINLRLIVDGLRSIKRYQER